jgi:hypothetical protein
VALIDPPASPALLALVAGGAPGAWVHALWGPSDVDFTRKVLAAELDLDLVMRRLWRSLSAGSGRFDEPLEQELVGRDGFLHSGGALAAGLRALAEAGLLVTEGDAYRLERPRLKVDVTTTDSYHAWHRLFHTSEYLETCLRAPL